MHSSYARSSFAPPDPDAPLHLYPYSRAAVGLAVGVRRLRSGYDGPLVRLRRASDDAEADFGYLPGGALDVGAITGWLAGAAGHVTTLYDQSGNAHDATQPDASRQPEFVAAATNGRPALRFAGAQWLGLGAGALGLVAAKHAVTVIAVRKYARINQLQQYVFFASSGTSAGRSRTAVGVDWTTLGSTGGRRRDGDSLHSLRYQADTQWRTEVFIQEWEAGLPGWRVYLDGALQAVPATGGSPTPAAGDSENTPSQAIRIGAAGNDTYYLTADLAELIVLEGVPES